jgi:hypothetical protein
MKQYGGDSFYYVPCDLETLGNNRVVETLHIVGIYVFYPVWAIDRLFGGPMFGSIPLDELAGPSEQRGPAKPQQERGAKP